MIKRKLAAEEIQKMKDGYIPAPRTFLHFTKLPDFYTIPCAFIASTTFSKPAILAPAT